MMAVAEFFRWVVSGARTLSFLRNVLKPQIEAVWFLEPWPEEAIVDCREKAVHTPAYVCVRIANRSNHSFYPKTIGLEYRPMAGFSFERVSPVLELRAEAPNEIPPGKEAELDFGTAAHALAVFLHDEGAGDTPLLRPVVRDRMGSTFPGRPDRFDVQKWRLGRRLSDDELENFTR